MVDVEQFKAYAYEVLGLFGIHDTAIQVVDEGAPHIPYALPRAKMAVYAFEFNGEFLKIGKVGPRSNNRFQYQHYSATAAPSTLAKSLMHDEKFIAVHPEAAVNIGQWIKKNVRRINVFIDVGEGVAVTNLLEAALQLKYNPRYEGFKSQRKTTPRL